ncbi:hypothetical protein DPEC_G00041680 [Dallia pectoralis]|uniref:Uncharacterized protein n=1 Tax=Dallia pectoralis TaxID=75939 RepID=A0ACC2H8M2_DALPE|nr:hypothetical protein DPEC_G00041680 [Dallia pectoralis]
MCLRSGGSRSHQTAPDRVNRPLAFTRFVKIFSGACTFYARDKVYVALHRQHRLPVILLRPPLPPELFPGISCFKAMFSPTHIPDPVQFTAPTQHGK